MFPVTLANAPIELKARVAGKLILFVAATHEERVAAILQVRERTISRTLEVRGQVDHQRSQWKPWSASEAPERNQAVKKWMLREEIVTLANTGTEDQQQRNNLHLSRKFCEVGIFSI